MTDGPIVEADFSGTVFGGAATWTDITSYVQVVSGSWGRSDWFSEASPSQFTVTLNNGDGRFTPGRSSSPYYPNVRYGTRVRYREVIGGGAVGNPVSLFTAVQQASEGGITSGSFTAPSGQLIVVTCSLFTPSSAAAATFSISSTHGLSWTQVTSTRGAVGNFTGAALFYAVGNGASGTVTVTPSQTGAGSSGMALSGFSVSGANSVGATGTSNGTLTVSLSGAPAVSSLVFGFLVAGQGSSPATTVPAGFTGLFTNRLSGPDTYDTAAYDNLSGPTSLVFGGSNANTAAVAVEIVAGTSVYMADGYVTDWDATPAIDEPWMSAIQCTDIFGRMASSTALRGFLVEEMMLDSPACLYPFQEDEGSTTFGDLTGNLASATVVNSKYGAGVVAAGQDAPGLLDSTFVEFTNSTVPAPPLLASSWLQMPFAGNLTAPLSWETWLQPTSTSRIVAPFMAKLGDDSSSTVIGFRIRTTGIPEFFIQVGGTLVLAAATASIVDGHPHHLVATYSGTTMTLYVDGVSAGSASGTIALPSAPAYMWIAPYIISASDISYSGSVAYSAVYPTALSAARVLAHYNAGVNAFSGETTAARAARILSYRTTLGSTIDTPLSNMGSGSITDSDQQQALIDTSDVEGGLIYADGQGRIAMRSRSRLFNPTAAATLNRTLGQVGSATTYTDSIQNTRNDVTVTRVNGADNRYFNQSNINTYGTFTDSKTLNIDTDLNALVMASWAVAQGTQDQLSIPSLECDLLAMYHNGYTTLVSSILQLAPLDTVTLTNLDSKAPATSMSVVIEGGGYTRSVAGEWSVQFNTAPAPPAVFAWDDSAHGWDSGAVWAP